jgi:O-antigen ligase
MKHKRLTWLFGFLLIMPPTTRYIPFGVDVGGIGFNLPRISMLACAVFATITLIRRPQLQLSYADIGVLSLLLLLILSTAWSIAPDESVRRATDLLFYIIYFASIVIYFNRETALEIFVSLLLLPAAAMVIYSALNVFIYDAHCWAIADLISRNGVTRDMVATFPILFLSMFARNSIQRRIRLILVGLMIVSVLLSGSRSGFVALFFAIALVILVWGRRIKQLSLFHITATGALGLGVMVVGVIAALLAGILSERLLRLPILSGDISPDTLGTARYHVRLAELSTIRSYPLVGIGYGAFFQYSAEQFGIGNYRAHSLITRVWMGAGLPGLSLLLLTGGLVLRNYIRQIIVSNSDNSLCLAGCLIGLLATTLTGMFNIVIIQPLFYLLVGVGSSTIVISKSNHS